MDDVFLKIGEMVDAQDQNGVAGVGEEGGNAWASLDPEAETRKRPLLVTGFVLLTSQMQGLLSKRATYAARRWILFSVMALIPLAMSVLTVISLNPAADNERTHPYRAIRLDQYNEPVTFIGTDNSTIGKRLGEDYKATLNNIGSVQMSPDVVQDIIDKGTGIENLAEYREKFIIGASFSSSSSLDISLSPNQPPISAPGFENVQLTALYNSVPLHARPLAQLHTSNALLRHLEANKTTKHSISLATHPLPEARTRSFETVAGNGVDMITYAFGITLPLGLAILVSSFLIFPLSERATNAKQVQIMTGLHPATFWVSNLLWDLLLFLLSSLAMLGLILILDQHSTFLTYHAWAALLLIMVLLGVCGTPFSYVFSFLANNPASGFAFLIIVNILAGCIAPTAVFMLRDYGAQFDSETLVNYSDIVRWIFNWFPIFPFARSLMAITTVQQANNLCELGIERETLVELCKNFKQIPQLIKFSSSAECCLPALVPPEFAICGKNLTMNGKVVIQASENPCHEVESFFTWDALRGINLDILILLVDGVLLFPLLVLIESKALARLWSHVKNFIPGYFQFASSYEELDNDVKEEQERVNNSNNNSDILRVSQLQKKFRHLEAVRQLTFGVKSGECFGLLGINGAGKTTTFRMLTGDEVASDGTASILNRHKLHEDRRGFLSQIGYCPQFDSIIPQLTGRELLRLMCRVRGVAPQAIEAEVERWTAFLGIQEYIDRQSGSYSGGNKRKLNVAMSLVGEPPLVFLDEPSTGVDPVARRNLWSIIGRIQRNGQSVVLTSHSMEECEALCDRLAIMVNGQFQCFGTVPHLKNKFALGFSILTKLRVTGSEEEGDDLQTAATLKDFVSSNLPNVEVKDEHKGYIHFHVQSPSTPWSTLFRVMEDARAEISSLEEYSISQTTLEQVFLNFARKQTTDM